MTARIVLAEIFLCDFDFGPVHRARGGAWHPVLLRLTDADGARGLGEAGLAFGAGARGAAGALRDLLEGFVLGRPGDAAAVRAAILAGAFWAHAPGPVLGAAMSAIDLALWDLAARRAGAPLSSLLGPRAHGDLPCYASQVQNGWGGGWTLLDASEDYAEAARAVRAEGFGALKVNPLVVGPDGRFAPPRARPDAADLARARDRVAAIREAAPELDVLIELHGITDVDGAAEAIAALAPLGIAAVEEPFAPLDAAGLARLAPLGVPIAGGERLCTAAEFAPLGALALIQPDVGIAGGITGARDIVRASPAAFQAHVCGSPVAAAAAAHLGVTLPSARWHEHHVAATMPTNRALCRPDWGPEGGSIAPPEGPGLGLELREGAVRAVAERTALRA